MKRRIAIWVVLCAALLLAVPSFAQSEGGTPQSYPNSTLNELFASLQMEMAQSALNSALHYTEIIKEEQKAQKLVLDYIAQARQLQDEARRKNEETLMPTAMERYIKRNAPPYHKDSEGSLHTVNEWNTVIQIFQGHLEQIEADIRMHEVYVQDFMKQYNSYMQGANAAMQGNMQPLSNLSRGQSLFSTEGGSLSLAPVATSLIIGIVIGMLVMWLILRKKTRGASK